MNKQRIDELLEFFSTELLENTMPFWMKHAPDKEFGGYFTTIGRDGQPLSSHKNIWIHGRFIWLLSHLYSVFEPRQEWLDMATHGMSFLDAHGFDENGKMYFTLARNGKPIRMRRYVFSEVFGVMAYAEYYRATQDKKYLEKALAILASMQKYSETPGLLEPKYNPETFATKGHSMT
ncbi:MAG: AGE family epimerase/isomerase, partial [Bacilli bacterium]